MEELNKIVPVMMEMTHGSTNNISFKIFAEKSSSAEAAMRVSWRR
jgi:hypothetical protein